MFCINFRFYNLIYDDDSIMGTFESLETEKFTCNFYYIRKTGNIYNLDSGQEVNLPPIGWLTYKLNEQGYLDEEMMKISY